MVCGNCNTMNDSDARFCKQCWFRTVPFEKTGLSEIEHPPSKKGGNPRWVDFSPEQFEALVSSLEQQGHSPDSRHPFFGKSFVISLFLDSLSEVEFWHCIARCGGLMKKNVSKGLNFLVEGDDHSGKYVKGQTGKSVKAREFNSRGESHIVILDETEFLGLLGSNVFNEVKLLEL